MLYHKKEMAGVERIKDAGRGTDTEIAHVTKGELFLPKELRGDPLVERFLQNIYNAAGLDINEFTVGDEANKINPETGQPEFFGKFFKSITKPITNTLSAINKIPGANIAIPIAATLLAPGVGTALSSGLGLGLSGLGATALGAGALGTGLNLASGKNIGSALKSGAISGGLTYGGGYLAGAAGNIGDTAIGRTVDGAYQGSSLQGISKDVSGALKNIYTGANGALDTVGSGINDAYQGSLVQDGFRSGADVLKSVGLDTAGGASTTAAAAPGGASSYEATDPSGKFSFGGGGSTADLNSSSPLLSSLSPFSSSTPVSDAIANTSTALSSAGGTPVAKDYSSITPLLSAALGYGSNTVAADELLKQQQANAALFGNANKTASDALLKQYQDNSALLKPYADGFSFTPGDLTADPGYQFQLTEGNRAADRANLARGNYFSGEALKEVQQFGTGLADTTYNNAFSRALQGRNAGLQGALSASGVNADFGKGTANNAINNAALLSDVNTNTGNIEANRTTNNGNLLSGALASLLGGQSFTSSGALQGGFDIQDFLRRNGLGGSSYAS